MEIENMKVVEIITKGQRYKDFTSGFYIGIILMTIVMIIILCCFR